MKMKSLGKQILLKQKQEMLNKTKKMPAGSPAGVSFCFSGIMLLKRPAAGGESCKAGFFLANTENKHGKVLCRAGGKDMESGMKINAICFETRNQR